MCSGYPAHMRESYDTATVVRDLETAGMDRCQAEAVAAAFLKAFEAGERVTRDELKSAVAEQETRFVRWVLAVAATVIAAVALILGA